MEGYCVKCKSKKKMTGVAQKVMGKKMHITGMCVVCKTKMSTFGKK